MHSFPARAQSLPVDLCEAHLEPLASKAAASNRASGGCQVFLVFWRRFRQSENIASLKKFDLKNKL